MNGQTLELESSHRLTVAPAGGDDPKTVTVTVQDGQRVALAHLTPDEAHAAAGQLVSVADHLAGTVSATFSVDVTPETKAALDDALAHIVRLEAELEERDAEIAALHIAAASKVAAPIDSLEDPKVEILEGEKPDEVA